MQSIGKVLLASTALTALVSVPYTASAADVETEIMREQADDRDPNIYGEEPGSEVPAYKSGDMYEGADLDPPGSSEVESGYGN